MGNIKYSINKNFSIIPNEMILDHTLSDRARFLFCLLASKPPDWIFFNKSLAKELGYSVDTLRKYSRELEKTGWIKVERVSFGPNNYELQGHKPTARGYENESAGKKPTLEKASTYKEVSCTKTYKNLKEPPYIPPVGETTNNKRETVSSTKRKTQIPEDYSPSPALLSWAEKQGYENVSDEVGAFVDFHRSKGNVFVQADLAFRTWLRNSGRFQKRGGIARKNDKHSNSNLDKFLEGEK